MSTSSVKLPYIRVMESILDEARADGLASGGRLPSVRELAGRYDVAKGTVEQAFRELVREGLCYAVERKGMFLAKEPPEREVPSTTVGIVLSYERYSEETNPFYRSLYEGAEAEAVGCRHNVLTLHEWRRKNPLQKNREVEQFRQQLAGFLALAVYDERDCLRLRDAGIPVVVVDYETRDLGVDCVVIDNPGVMRSLCAAVLAEAPGRVLLVDFERSREYDPAIRERREAFREALAAAGRDVTEKDFVYMDWSEGPQPALEPLKGLFAAPGARPAVVCTDETAARAFLGALGEDRPEPGRDFLLAYLGFLRPQHRDMADVPALIGAVDFRELGRAGMRLLEERIEKGPGRAVRRAVGGEVVSWPGK